MEGTAIQFVNTTPDQLAKTISEAVAEQINQIKKDFEPKKPEEYLSRTELRDLLKINLSTIHAWRRKGVITAYTIEGRVFFKRSEIDKLLKPIEE